MSKLATNKALWTRRKNRVRGSIHGTAGRPRLSIYRSNNHIYAQIIDDDKGVTLAASSTRDKDVASNRGKEDIDKKALAALVGEQLAQRAQTAGVTKVVFDRNGFRYHGRLAALADGARKNGLEF